MATGAPDWQGLQWKVEATQRPSLIYPSGKIIFYDDFESANFKWTKVGHANSETELSTVVAFAGTASMKLKTPAIAGATAVARTLVALPPSNKVGIEEKINFRSSPGTENFVIQMIHYTGTIRHTVTAKIDLTANTLSVINSLGEYQIVESGISISRGVRIFHSFKLIVDFAKDVYVTVFLDETAYDLSEISIQTAADATAENIRVQNAITNVVALAATYYVDDVVLTEE